MFSQAVADEICSRLAEGQSLRAVCRDAEMPDHSTVLKWVRESGEFSNQYARAREVSYQLLADEIIEISDDSKGDSYTDKNGNEQTDAERVARSKLRVDSRKWMLSKMLPKVYGDRIETVHSGRIGLAREMTDEELAAIAMTK